jgi:glucose-6-phosphate 1-dehydrogenase
MADTVIQPKHEEVNAGNMELKDNTIIVVLGASGDLAKKKTFPALFGLVGCTIKTRIRLLTINTAPKQLSPKEHPHRRICTHEDGS